MYLYGSSLSGWGKLQTEDAIVLAMVVHHPLLNITTALYVVKHQGLSSKIPVYFILIDFPTSGCCCTSEYRCQYKSLLLSLFCSKRLSCTSVHSSWLYHLEFYWMIPTVSRCWARDKSLKPNVEIIENWKVFHLEANPTCEARLNRLRISAR